MSVVVAIKEGNRIYIGSDSQTTRGSTRRTLNNVNNYKIWKVLGVDNCLMAHVGTVREANVIRIMRNLVTDYEVYKDYIDFSYVVESIVPDIVKQLEKYKYIKIENDYLDEMHSRFLFAFKDQLYVIDRDGCVLEIDDCVAIGSGEGEAIGSLLSTDGEDPKIRIIKAIKASAAADIYVDYPIILTDTLETEFEVINENNEKDFIKKKGRK